ncbi:glyoxalase/bleomycin resistance protein/dioxygenase superfamily protein [Streptococcus porcinus]|uniref:VOC family protein n=1 Tax=Streptococcus porcinus TaxID=1340 RepID=A0A4V6L3J1_STRPO|nr:VOC family protein [Streptococcus porcinus]MBA2795587.1 VOC family protein [Streptococcus porcinus]VTS28187.1 glyoxalase/bleomycin resistance protein/dioxygenase superfamily protein [Streptococcus porcinus]
MKLSAIHHVAIIVSDYDKSKDFYVNQLGFEIIRENHRSERHDYKLDLKCGDIELEIFGNSISDPAYQAPPKRIGQPEYNREACGLRHLAFRVKNIENYIKELKAKNIRVEPLRYDDYTGEKMTFFFDPDGLPLELHE